MKLAAAGNAFDDLGAVAYGLALAGADDLEDLQEKLGEGVTLLADPSGEAVRAFGMLDEDAFPRGPLARAGTFWIGPRGRIRGRWLPASYRERPEPSEILRAIRAGR